MSQLIRVILADDHPVVRRGLAAMIDIEDDIEVVGVAKNGQEAVRLVHAQQPDVVLMDLQMPIMDGVEATIRIRAEFPHIPVLILTTFNDKEYIYDCITAGARGYLLKDADPEQLIEAIRAASRGESLLDPVVAAHVLDHLYYMYMSTQSGSTSPPTAPPKPQPKAPPQPIPIFLPKLTRREQEVLELMAEGRRNKTIAKTLVITERTVRVHVGNIFHKLNVSNRTEAVALAMRVGWL